MRNVSFTVDFAALLQDEAPTAYETLAERLAAVLIVVLAAFEDVDQAADGAPVTVESANGDGSNLPAGGFIGGAAERVEVGDIIGRHVDDTAAVARFEDGVSVRQIFLRAEIDERGADNTEAGGLELGGGAGEHVDNLW